MKEAHTGVWILHQTQTAINTGTHRTFIALYASVVPNVRNDAKTVIPRLGERGKEWCYVLLACREAAVLTVETLHHHDVKWKTLQSFSCVREDFHSCVREDFHTAMTHL